MKTIKTPKKEMIKEHEHLVKVLEKGSAKQRALEAKKQKYELKKYKKN